MATEETRLLKKPFDYLSTASKDCIVVVSADYHSDDIDECLGLTIEELYLYMNDPWWRLLRRSILISFWILLFAIFASACIISIVEYKQQCSISNMKPPPFSGLNVPSIDIISRPSYAQSATALASNSTAVAFMINSLAAHQVQLH